MSRKNTLAAAGSISPSVGTLNEGHLHASLKARYLEPGDLTEAAVDGYIVDILRGDYIIEIQTGSFAKIARKMRDLVTRHSVRLVYPVPRNLWIVKMPKEVGDGVTRRRSPKHLSAIDVFSQLVSFPELMAQENFELDIVLTEEETLWSHAPGKRWRRKGWVTIERRLLQVYETVSLRAAHDYMALIPSGLPEAFLTADLAGAIGCPRRVSQQVAYCLSRGGFIEKVGMKGNAIVYGRVGPN